MIMTSTIRINKKLETLIRFDGVDAVKFDRGFVLYISYE